MKGALAALLGAGGLVALLFWASVFQSAVTCEVCVPRSGGGSYCAETSAPTRAEAREGARRTACSTVGGGVSGDLACLRAPPVSVACSE